LAFTDIRKQARKIEMTQHKKHTIASVLIANRGEIASRIIRTCRKMGIKSIAVYSDADREAIYVSEADQAIHIGESNPTKSYLDEELILKAAKTTQADAIHPGYGFLSENAGFAEKCAKAGVIFIGPNPKAIAAMGSKSEAKKLMQKHGVPVVPGYQGDDQTVSNLREKAIEIGFPLLLKASAGGGGKGMRIVQDKSELEAAIKAAKSESLSAFGNDELIIEKYIERGRHIEFQIFGDQHGNAIHLLERECTIQRRYQKVIEESPSPIMTDDLRKEMGDAAVNAAKALEYDNAGTVEFIFDDKTGEYFFLEVNTRLQVEHPVTEEITGLDLVKMQIESAQGRELNIQQANVQSCGYAIEVRLYAEDASNNFMPATGIVGRFEFPKVEGLRIETAVKSGSEVSVFYDPMIAKVIVHDMTRLGAHRKMQYVLQNLICQGLTTNLDILQSILAHPDFTAGTYDTHFIDEKINLAALKNTETRDAHLAAIAHCLFSWNHREKQRSALKSIPSGWRNNFYQAPFEDYQIDESDFRLYYKLHQNNGTIKTFNCQIDDCTYSAHLISANTTSIALEIDGLQQQFHINIDPKNEALIEVQASELGNISLKKAARFPEVEKERIKGGYETPMPSQIMKILVTAGAKVEIDDPLIVLSSMKMENTIAASEAGTVEEVFVEEGGNVPAGFLLLKINSTQQATS